MPAKGARVTTAKQLQGKKGTGRKDLHPESRRVKQAARVELRTKRVTEDRKTRAKLEQEKIDRLLWFIREMDPNKSALTIDELHEVAQQYLARLDGQLEEEKSLRRPGRLMSKRQQEIEATKAREELQYTKEGLVMPDLCDEESVQSARYWDEQLRGSAGYYSRIRLIRLFKGEKEVAVEQKGEPLGPNTEAEQPAQETSAQDEVVMEE
ncbi:hypothetical protein P389DRAFT_173907 [Cystobasidium minutum MCA 4210]|uniref:uncharacterized protein n=1 Tax=Cystobasidium minutum MCA 4210 TaxID=1397322 RepID=UPI0034CFB3A9|eukprot:jgi/Rhomi1/173907/fgenesh1_kg.6_\